MDAFAPHGLDRTAWTVPFASARRPVLIGCEHGWVGPKPRGSEREAVTSVRHTHGDDSQQKHDSGSPD